MIFWCTDLESFALEALRRQSVSIRSIFGVPLNYEDLGHGKKQKRTSMNLYCSTFKLDLYQEDFEFVSYPCETKASLRSIHFFAISSLLLENSSRHIEPVQLDLIVRFSCFSGYNS